MRTSDKIVGDERKLTEQKNQKSKDVAAVTSFFSLTEAEVKDLAGKKDSLTTLFLIVWGLKQKGVIL